LGPQKLLSLSHDDDLLGQSSSAQSLLTTAVQCCCLAKLDFTFRLKTCSPYARPPHPYTCSYRWLYPCSASSVRDDMHKGAISWNREQRCVMHDARQGQGFSATLLSFCMRGSLESRAKDMHATHRSIGHAQLPA
jgi:hypothetical protein